MWQTPLQQPSELAYKDLHDLLRWRKRVGMLQVSVAKRVPMFSLTDIHSFGRVNLL